MLPSLRALFIEASLLIFDRIRKKSRVSKKMWLLNVPRMAREVTSFAQDVRWLVDIARDACRAPPKPPEPEMEMATNFRLQPRDAPEPWSREYEAWDPGWTLVRTSNDPFYSQSRRVL